MSTEGGRAYTQDKVPPEAVIGKDGQNLSPDVVSMETAEQIMAGQGGSDGAGEQEDSEVGKEGAEVTQEGGDEGDKGGEAGKEGPAAAAAKPGDVAGARKPADDPEITIGGIKKKFSELVKEAEDDYKADFSELPAETVKKIVDGFIASQHDAVWKKNNTQRSEEVAKARKANEDKERQLSAERTKIESDARFIAAEKQRILKEETKLKETISKAVPKDEVMDEDGRIINADKYELYLKGKQAQERLTEINEDKKQIENESAQSDRDRIVNSIELFQATIPQYGMTRPFAETVGRFQKNPDSKDPDFPIYQELRDIAELAAVRGLSMVDAYQHLKRQGRLAIKAEDLPALPEETSQSSAVQKLTETISRKQQAAGVPLAKGATTTRRSVRAQIPLGDKLRDASKRALTGVDSSNNEALTTLGF